MTAWKDKQNSQVVAWCYTIEIRVYRLSDNPIPAGSNPVLTAKKENMNKENFEQRGWKFSYEFENEMKFEKGDVWKDNGQGAFLRVKNNIVKLITTDSGFNQDGPNNSIKFNGECNTMDEFDMICKMIKLKI